MIIITVGSHSNVLYGPSYHYKLGLLLLGTCLLPLQKQYDLQLLLSFMVVLLTLQISSGIISALVYVVETCFHLAAGI